jgi:hypothetical protein
MRPVAFGEALPAGTRLTLFSDDKLDRFFTVIKFWLDETSDSRQIFKAEAIKVRLDSLHEESLAEPFRSVVLALHSNGLLELRDLLP